MDNLRIIDALGPFTAGDDKHILNWSKIPFSHLEKDAGLDKKRQIVIKLNFEKYCKKVSSLGYNALSIDDLAHLVIHEFYNPSLKKLLNDYQQLYKELFAIAVKYNFKIFVNTDYMFFNNDIYSALSKRRQSNDIKIQDFFIETLQIAFKQYPDISGIIIRIGESDGKDVKDNFLSRLILKTPEQVNIFLKRILPIFEQYNKTLIFRTWTVGVYKIGDLMWNKQTFDTAFSSIESKNFIIGMKFGDTDFFRYCSLNPLFFEGKQRKVIELQTKKEYEGMGLYPSFIGWDYKEYLKELQSDPHIAGIHVWCQTGGWTQSATWKNITFLENSSFWNELNTYVIVKIYYEKKSTEDAVSDFCEEKGIKDTKAFIHLLKLSEIVIKNGLYIKEFASKKLYFRRLRIPPLLWIHWDRSFINSLTKNLILLIVKDKRTSIQEGLVAVDAIEKMIEIGEKTSMENAVLYSLEFELETFKILAEIRKTIFLRFDDSEKEKLQKQIELYQKKYPEHYLFSSEIPKTGSLFLKSIISFSIRWKGSYRLIDKISLWLTPLQKLILLMYIKKSAPSLSNQAMGIETVFK